MHRYLRKIIVGICWIRERFKNNIYCLFGILTGFQTIIRYYDESTVKGCRLFYF